MKRLAVAATVLVALACASGASGWTGNTFQNPTGNIQCVFTLTSKQINPNLGPGSPVWIKGGPELICDVYSSHRFVVLDVNKKALTGKPNEYSRGSGLPVLRYGQKWQSHQFVCLSTYQGMRCWTGSLDHGFLVSAWTVKVW